MDRILITGGAGFIGSHLIAGLSGRKNTCITCFDSFEDLYPASEKRKNLQMFAGRDHFSVIKGDVRNKDDIRMIPEADIVIHLAALAGVRQSLLHPDRYDSVNRMGTANMLEYAQRVKAKIFILASSSSIYGNCRSLPAGEQLIPDCKSPYAISKYRAELLGRTYSRRWGMRFLALRFFSVYGPRQRPDQVISKLFRSAIDGLPVPLLGSGHSTRDYTYVEDIIAGLVSAITYCGSDFEIFNLGTGCPVSLFDLRTHIEALTNTKIRVLRKDAHPCDVMHTCADIGKARDLLDYHPMTDIGRGLLRTFRVLANEHAETY